MPAAPKVMLGCSVTLLAGCGNARTAVPSATRPVPRDGFTTLTRAYAGARLAVPRNWVVTGQRAPLVVTIQSGTAVVSLWRFARSGPVPAGRHALAAAAIELEAQERVGGLVRQVSSAHVYLPGAELVLDEYAPPDAFATVNRSVFAPVRRSLVLIRSGAA